MKNEDISDDDLEEELDKAFKTNEKKRNVFSMMRKEKDSLELKEMRVKKDIKFKSD